MSGHWSYLLLLLPAVPLVREDFRSREVAVVWLAGLAAAAVAVVWATAGLRTACWNTGGNFCVLAFLAGMMTVWQLVRRKPLRKFFSDSLGAGDAVMLMTLTPLFTPAGYVRFLMAACAAALGWWCVKRPPTLPLAGFMALTLAGYAILKTAGIWS